MKHRILAAMICVCAALTSLCVPALADDTEAETPVPVEATPGTSGSNARAGGSNARRRSKQRPHRRKQRPRRSGSLWKR